MLDINFIRDNSDKVKAGISAKGYDATLVDNVLKLDKQRREVLQLVEGLRAERNRVAELKDIERGKAVKSELKVREPELDKVNKEFEEVLFQIPNIPAEDVPIGKDESENKVIRKWGEPKEFAFKPKEHMEMGESLGIIDTEKSAKISGARFNYLFGEAALLQFALIQFALSVLTNEKIIGKIAQQVGNPYSKPFIPVIPPVFAKSEIMKKMDRFHPIEERYYLEKDDLLLIGSAEHTLGPLHMGETLSDKDLPIRYVGYSTSFRREAGAYGKDVKGILRRHQFDKLEMESFTLPKDGDAEQKLMVAIQEHLMQELGIPYQIVVLCTGDMGKPDIRHIDIEAWMPGQGKYRETHTSDYMGDYQARRLNTRVKKGKETHFVYMNDATAIAIGRTLIAILENYQQEDGSVKIPEVLQKFMGLSEIKAK